MPRILRKEKGTSIGNMSVALHTPTYLFATNDDDDDDLLFLWYG